jgi:circadian clock protein KaiC
VPSDERISVGVDGLDGVLGGGLLPGRGYLVSGRAGSGKTILGHHFLTAATDDEDALFIALEEPVGRLVDDAEQLGFDVDDVHFVDLSPKGDVFAESRSYDLFAADEAAGPSITDRIVEAVETVEPDRVFVDPVSRLHLLAPDDHQFRREVASFLTYLIDYGATVLFSTQPTSGSTTDDLEFVSDGHIHLGTAEKGRTVEVTKLRGSGFQSGTHTMRIDGTGISVFPRLVPGSHRREHDMRPLGSGVGELDTLLDGGIERGTVTVISGPSGVGKTTTGTQFLAEAVRSGERSVAYLFEETTETFCRRSESIGIPVEEMRDDGTLTLSEVESLTISSDEFAAQVREEVEENDARVVMLDGISGYRLSIRGETDDLVRELHALCRYLKNMGVTVVLVDEVAKMTGDIQVTSTRISYLADNIVFLRYLEMRGELRKAVGVLKKRASDFERTLREFEITDEGIVLGEPLRDLRGVLTGTPEWNDGGD